MYKGPHERRGLGAGRRETVDTVLARRQPDLTVLAERLDKPRNFSAIIRSCDAVGIGEVHAVRGDGRIERQRAAARNSATTASGSGCRPVHSSNDSAAWPTSIASPSA